MSQMSTPWIIARPAGRTPEGTTAVPPLYGGIEAIASTSAELESLRGVSSAAADLAECTCPEPCERDHANE